MISYQIQQNLKSTGHSDETLNRGPSPVSLWFSDIRNRFLLQEMPFIGIHIFIHTYMNRLTYDGRAHTSFE